jgi:hypothetical protein
MKKGGARASPFFISWPGKFEVPSRGEAGAMGRIDEGCCDGKAELDRLSDGPLLVTMTRRSIGARAFQCESFVYNVSCSA